MADPTSGHWLAGMWHTIQDYLEYITGLMIVLWGLAMFSLKSVYVTKKELSEKLDKIADKNEEQHKTMADKIDKLNDMLITYFSHNGK